MNSWYSTETGPHKIAISVSSTGMMSETDSIKRKGARGGQKHSCATLR